MRRIVEVVTDGPAGEATLTLAFEERRKSRQLVRLDGGEEAALDAGIPEQLGLRRRAVAVKHTRAVGKRDMVLNSGTPKIEVDPQTYEVRADGVLLTCEPAKSLPMAQRYFLF
jgi:urease alpha subunit